MTQVFRLFRKTHSSCEEHVREATQHDRRTLEGRLTLVLQPITYTNKTTVIPKGVWHVKST